MLHSTMNNFIQTICFGEVTPTWYRMIKFGMEVSLTCLLCSLQNESVNHLCMDMPFTLENFQRCSIYHSFVSLHSLRSQILFLYIGVIIYCVRIERNFRLHNLGLRNSVAAITKKVQVMTSLASGKFIKAAKTSMLSKKNASLGRYNEWCFFLGYMFTISHFTYKSSYWI